MIRLSSLSKAEFYCLQYVARAPVSLDVIHVMFSSYVRALDADETIISAMMSGMSWAHFLGKQK